jgi:hypothetical protein
MSFPAPREMAEEIESIVKVEFCDRTTVLLSLLHRGLRVYRSDPRRVARIAEKAKRRAALVNAEWLS